MSFMWLKENGQKRNSIEINNKFNSIKNLLLHEPFFSIPNLVWLFLALDILTRLFWIGRESIWLDESLSIIHASETASLGNLLNLYSFGKHWGTDHPLLYYLLLHEYINFLWTYKGIPNETVLRILSAIFGVIILPMVYFAGKLIDKKVGILASFLLLMNTCNLYYSQMGRMYTLTSLLVLMSSFVFYGLLTEKKDNAYSKYINYIFISILLIYADYVGFLVLGFHCIYGVVYYWISKDLYRLKRLLISYSIMFILYLPWLPVFYSPLKRGGTDWMGVPSIYDASYALRSVMGLPIDTNPSLILNWIVFLILVLFLIIGIITSFKDKVSFNSLVAAICAIPLFMFFISLFTNLHIFSERQISAFAPEFDLILATGLVRSYQSIPRVKPPISKGFVIATLILGASLMIVSMYSYYVTDTYEDWRSAARYIEENIQSHDFIVFDAGFCKTPFEFYFNLTRFDTLGMNEDSKLIDSPIDPFKYSTIWVVLSHTKHGVDDYIKWIDESSIKYNLTKKGFRKIDILQFDIIR